MKEEDAFVTLLSVLVVLAFAAIVFVTVKIWEMIL